MEGTNNHANPVLAKLYRFLGLMYGFGNQLVFLVTVWFLFWFLRDGSVTHEQGNWILRDALLATMFAVVHSLMLAMPVRRWLTQWIPRPFYDSTFCLVTCISLLLLFFGWRNSETNLWDLNGLAKSVVHVCFYASWIALFYSLALTGLGYQNGWTPFYYWMRQVPAPRREFTTKGAYRHFRHPVYLSFLGLVWFTPVMTLDHFVLTAIWTAYIFLGSWLKDMRLAGLIGSPYKQYMSKVPGYPIVVPAFRYLAKRVNRQNNDAVATDDLPALN